VALDLNAWPELVRGRRGGGRRRCLAGINVPDSRFENFAEVGIAQLLAEDIDANALDGTDDDLRK
jgi:hypothetical protein